LIEQLAHMKATTWTELLVNIQDKATIRSRWPS